MLPDDITHALRAFTRAQLIARTSERRVRTAISNGELLAVLPGVYAGRVHATSFMVRAQAAVLWCGPSATLSGAAAIRWWGATLEEPAVITVIADQSVLRTPPPWLRVIRSRHAPDHVELMGVCVAPLPNSLVQAWIDGGESAVVYGLFARRAIRVAQVRAVLARTPRVARRRALERILANVESGAESFLEVEARDNVFVGRDFDTLVRQHRVRAGGDSFRLDAYDEATRTAFELDSERHHGSLEARLADVRRDALLAAEGILTVRFHYQDVTRRPRWCADVARRVLRSRGGTVSIPTRRSTRSA